MTPPRYIYLHGFASSPSSRKAQFFRQHFEQLGLDLRIPQLDEGDFTSLTVGAQLKVIERQAQDAPDVVLLGSSLGGYLSALYAARHPDQVSKLVLLAPAFGFPGRWREAMGDERMRKWKEQGSVNMFHYGSNAMRPISYRLIEEAASYEDYPEVSQPTLILHGTADDVVPPRYAEEFARRHPDSTKLVLLDSGHELTDVQDKLWNETQSFLQLSMEFQS